jgi:hypothetical protein
MGLRKGISLGIRKKHIIFGNTFDWDGGDHLQGFREISVGFGLLCRHTASPPITSGTHTSGVID